MERGKECSRSHESIPPPDSQAGETCTGERVLVCEDEGITQIQIERILTLAGFEVVGCAMTGKEAVEMALRERPSLILMDIGMPDMNGLEAMERILAVYHPCFVVISAYDRDMEAKARAKGARAYIAKPINNSSLLHDLKQAFQT